MGWLRILAEWVGAQGRVVGSDIDDGMLARARAFVEAEALANVTLAQDDLFAGRELPSLMRRHGLEPRVEAQVVALPPGHPYLRLPLQFATSLRPRLEALHGGR